MGATEASDLSAGMAAQAGPRPATIDESASLINFPHVVDSSAGVKRLSGAESPTPFEDDEP